MRKLGPHTLGARLGTGALGEVFLAASPARELVAVKKYEPSFGRDIAFVRDLTAECKAASRLDIAGVLQMFDFGREGDQLWSAQPAVPGQALSLWAKRARLESVSLPPVALAGVGARLASSLVALHDAERADGRRGFVLGRLAMRDILVSYDGQVFLTGVGESRARARVTIASRRLPYCAPEVMQGREPTARSDVFSLSAILYELFSGTAAFRRNTPEATMEAVRRGDVSPLRPARSGVDPRLGELIMQGLLPRPEARPETLEELAARLRDVAGDDDGHEAALAAVADRLFAEQIESWRRMTEALLRGEAAALPSELPSELEVPIDSSRVPTDDLLGGRSGQPNDPPSFDTSLPEPSDAGASFIAREGAGDDLQRLSRVARYRVGRRVEIDGRRQRFIATDPNLGREVDLEVLDPEAIEAGAERSDAIRAVKQEGRYAAQLQLDGLPRLLDAGRAGSMYFLVYERSPGRSLPRHLAEGRPIDPAQIVADLAAVLDQVHRKGFVLGDLRPAVVRLRTDGRAEVSRARRLTPVERAPHPLMKFDRGLQPPELVRIGAYTPASDQFWAGALLYQLLLGFAPFQAHDGKSLREAISGDQIVPPHVADSNVPERLSMACLRMLERNPARRFPSMRDVVDAMGEQPSTRVRAAPALPDDDTLEISLGFAHLCRRVAGISTQSGSDDSPWHPEPALWASDIARRVGLTGREVQAVLIAAAARDLARRTRLPVLGPELDMVLPSSARALLEPDGPREGDDGALTGRSVLELVERFSELVTSGDVTPLGAVQRLRGVYAPELVDALVAHLDDRLPGTERPGPRVLAAVSPAERSVISELEARGLVVIAAGDGPAAWELLRGSRFDGAVLSAQLPGRDGLSLAQKCRQVEALRSLPLWLTGEVGPEDAEAAGASGAVVESDIGRLVELVAERLVDRASAPPEGRPSPAELSSDDTEDLGSEADAAAGSAG